MDRWADDWIPPHSRKQQRNKFNQQLINELRSARKVEKPKMAISKAILKMSFNSVPVEIHVEEIESDVTEDTIKSHITNLLSVGFSAPVQWNRTGDDVIDKVGTVIKVEASDGKMFAVTCKLDAVEKEFVFKAFTANEFRKGDRIKVVKNDRGFKTGQLITEDEEAKLKQMELATTTPPPF